MLPKDSARPFTTQILISSLTTVTREFLEEILKRQGKKAKKSPSSRKTFKHGLEVLRTWKDVVRIDADAGNRCWQEAIEKEITALMMHDCFYFKTLNFKPPANY